MDLSSSRTLNNDYANLYGADKGLEKMDIRLVGFYFYRSPKNALQFKI